MWRTLCAATHPRRRGTHRAPARGRNLPDLSLRASDRCHWRGNPFPLAFRSSPALRFMAGRHACRRPDFLIAQKVSKDAPGRGKIPNLSPLPGPLSSFKRPKGVIPLLENPEIPPAPAKRTKCNPGVRITRRICKLRADRCLPLRRSSVSFCLFPVPFCPDQPV